MFLRSAGRRLLWQEWDDLYLVYQAASAETHVFNETTVLILRSLDRGPLATDQVKALTEEALGVPRGGLDDEDFNFAVGRLEELGLIESSKQAIAAR